MHPVLGMKGVEGEKTTIFSSIFSAIALACRGHHHREQGQCPIVTATLLLPTAQPTVLPVWQWLQEG